jgi:hypothetical protein
MADEDDVEIDLDDWDVDETGQVVKVTATEPIPAPKTVRGSVSLINDYLACPAKAYGRITRQVQHKGIALAKGIAVHEALEAFIKEDGNLDAEKTFLSVLDFECDKNLIAKTNEKYAEARKTGLYCTIAGVTILKKPGSSSGTPLFQRLDKEYVERGFAIERNGRKYVGKMDFVMFVRDKNSERQSYVIGDWKSGKTAPNDIKLLTDLQFSMYAYAGMYDINSPKTYGTWMHHGTYVHLPGQSLERHPSGKRKSVKDVKNPDMIQRDFTVQRTQEQVEADFTDTIEPVMEQMEKGVWFRKRTEDCSWCGFWSSEKMTCTVELPSDAKQRIREANEEQMLSLITHSELTESKKAGLKPYA